MEANDDIREFRMYMLSLYDKSYVTLDYSADKVISLHTDNIEMAGNVIQSLAKFLNLENLQVRKETHKRDVFN